MTVPDVAKRSSLWVGVCWVALAATFVLFAAASFFPEKRLWGLNHLAFYGERVRLVVLVVTGLFLVPPLASATWRGIVWAARPYFRGLETGYNAIALTGVASFALFAALRSSTLLLGDGHFIINTFQKAVGNDLGIVGFFRIVTLEERIYPAAELLNYAASWTAGRFGASPVGGVWILNCAIGAAVVVGVLATVRRVDWPVGAKVAVCALALLSGAVELFFGYIEHYTPALALGALYLLMSIRALRGQSRVWKPGLILLIAILFHVQSLLLAPSYVWLLAWSTVGKRFPASGGRIALVVAAATTAAALAAAFVPSIQRFYLPPLGQGSAYHVFSAAHLLDVANAVVLLCPVWLLYAALVVRRRLLLLGDDRPRDHGAAAFAWTLTVPAVLFLFLFRPELGMARDWDLFCFTVFGLAAPGLLACMDYASHPRHSEGSAPILSPAVALSAALVFSWVGVNADTERSVARYRAILQYDRTNPGYAYETLARHFEDRFQYSRQMDALNKAYDASNNPRYLLKMARTLYENDDAAGAMKWFRRYLDVRPEDDDARKTFLRLLALESRVDEMVVVSRAGIENSPRVPEFHFFLGNAYLAMGMKEEGLKAFESCSRLNPPPNLVEAMMRLMEQAGAAPSDPK
jgi:hypothetical protein